jgi:hypothetical protein
LDRVEDRGIDAKKEGLSHYWWMLPVFTTGCAS